MEAGLPTTRHEEWKYDTFLSELRRHAFQAATADAGETAPTPFDMPVNHIIFSGGTPALHVTDEDADLVRWLPEAGPLPQWLAADREENPFIDLAAATAPGRLHIRIPAGRTPSRPFVITYAAAAEKAVFLPAVLTWEVEEGGTLTLWETAQPAGNAPVWLLRLGYGTVAPNGKMTHGLLQTADGPHYEIFHTHTQLAAHTHYAHDYFGWSSRRRSRHNLHVTFTGPRAEGHMKGLFLTEGKGFIDVHSRFTHAAPECHSNEQYHGLLRDQGVGVFNGKIYVHPEAQKTDAYQSSRNILLDGVPTMNAKPQLEIFADDVRCSHGCTVGPLDERSIFYLESRGIRPEQARTMLAAAFGRQVIQEMNTSFAAAAAPIFEEKIGHR